MGDGLKRVCKQCGGLTTINKDGKTIEFDKNGKKITKKEKKNKKRLQTFESFISKLNETGEWNRGVDWEYVKDNPESIERDDQAAWIKFLADELEEIKSGLSRNIKMTINDIKGFDNYKGPYALITINNGVKLDNFKVWTTSDQNLWIEDFPVDNTSDDDNSPGYQGFVSEIIDVINDYYSTGKSLLKNAIRKR